MSPVNGPLAANAYPTRTGPIDQDRRNVPDLAEAHDATHRNAPLGEEPVRVAFDTTVPAGPNHDYRLGA
jgi:hypothetical protein